MTCTRWFPYCRTTLLLFAGLAIFGVCVAAAQAQRVQFVADSKSSLAWWQMNPHMGHLWATTCPSDPSWVPGEGVTPSGAAKLADAMRRRIGQSTRMDSIIPLYPRRELESVCNEAVRAEITVEDLATMRGAKGVIAVRVKSLYTGMTMRDGFTFRLLEADAYPEIIFHVDSLSHVEKGDTTHANAYGRFDLHGQQRGMVVPVKVWKDGAGLRVVGQFAIAAQDMTKVYGLSKVKLGLGVGTNIWKLLHMGIDVVLKERGAGE